MLHTFFHYCCLWCLRGCFKNLFEIFFLAGKVISTPGISSMKKETKRKIRKYSRGFSRFLIVNACSKQKCLDEMQLVFDFFRKEITYMLHRFTSELSVLIYSKKCFNFFLRLINFLKSTLQSSISIKYMNNYPKCVNASKLLRSTHSYHYFLRKCFAKMSLKAYNVL